MHPADAIDQVTNAYQVGGVILVVCLILIGVLFWLIPRAFGRTLSELKAVREENDQRTDAHVQSLEAQAARLDRALDMSETRHIRDVDARDAKHEATVARVCAAFDRRTDATVALCDQARSALTVDAQDKAEIHESFRQSTVSQSKTAEMLATTTIETARVLALETGKHHVEVTAAIKELPDRVAARLEALKRNCVI